ncbi:hypothetical protein FOA52_013138 [Chlamydomonas sp. UWO 241]|nr:hypothetical protein FOA52_013138 [Chlamydomonas sp. UWO 241]
MIEIQLSARAVELLCLPNDGTPKMLLDIGCGSGLSGEELTDKPLERSRRRRPQTRVAALRAQSARAAAARVQQAGVQPVRRWGQAQRLSCAATGACGGEKAFVVPFDHVTPCDATASNGMASSEPPRGAPSAAPCVPSPYRRLAVQGQEAVWSSSSHVCEERPSPAAVFASGESSAGGDSPSHGCISPCEGAQPASPSYDEHVALIVQDAPPCHMTMAMFKDSKELKSQVHVSKEGPCPAKLGACLVDALAQDSCCSSAWSIVGVSTLPQMLWERVQQQL